MKSTFPTQSKQYLQNNRSNVLGNLWATQGIDFQSNLGVIRLAKRFQVLTKTGDANATNLGCPIGFKFYNGRYYTVGDTRVFKNSSTSVNSAFVEETSTGARTDYSADQSDIGLFNSLLWTTTPAKIYSFNASAWTERGTFAASSVPHMVDYFEKFNRLYSTDSGGVHSIDTSNVFTTTGSDYDLTVSSGNTLTCLRCNSQFVWIGTISANATGYGTVIQWDGIAAQPTQEFIIKARGVESITIKDDIPYIMDSEGILSEFTGTSFKEVGRLPAPKRLNNYLNSSNDRFIHPNGLLTTKNDTVLALVNNLNLDGTTNENFSSGVWEWSRDIGFTQKNLITYNPYNTSTVTDFGQNKISRIGGIALAQDASSSGLLTLITGANYYTDATTVTSGIFIENTIDTIQKSAYFVTDWFSSQEAEENWTRMWNFYKLYGFNTDLIYQKYRNVEVAPLEVTITWTSTTTFTTSTDVTSYSPTATGFDGTTGGEVEVLQGTGSGLCSQITSIVNNAGTYTVTVDTVYTGVTNGTAKARFQKWIKIGIIDSARGQVKSWQQLAIASSNENRIQVKTCMTYTGEGEFYGFAINSSTNVKVTT